jgi:hypothetical protein
MKMDDREEQFSKAPLPIVRSLEPDSNVTVFRFMQERKQFSPSLSTPEGRQMDDREKQL